MRVYADDTRISKHILARRPVLRSEPHWRNTPAIRVSCASSLLSKLGVPDRSVVT
jgi:hypothetical protein